MRDFTQHIDFITRRGLEHDVDLHPSRQLRITLIEESFQLVDRHALQRYGADFRETRIAVVAHGDLPGHARTGLAQGGFEILLVAQRAGD